MTTLVYRELTKNPKIWNTLGWVLFNIWRLGQVKDTNFCRNVSNEKLLNAEKCQVYRENLFWLRSQHKLLVNPRRIQTSFFVESEQKSDIIKNLILITLDEKQVNFPLENYFVNIYMNEQVRLFTQTNQNIIPNYIPHETISCDDRNPPQIDGKNQKNIGFT